MNGKYNKEAFAEGGSFTKKISGAELAGVAAMRSVYLPGQGRLSQVYVDGDSLYDPRRIRSLLAALARHYAVDIVAMRLRCGELLAARNFLPLPLSSRTVLVPLALSQEGERTGYVNLLAMEGIRSQEAACSLILKGGTELTCWLSARAVRERLLRARYLLWELSAEGLLPSPGQGEIWRQKLEIIRTILE